MRLVLFNDYRLGVLRGEDVIDVTSALPNHDPGLGASFFVRLCQDFEALRPQLEQAAANGKAVPLAGVKLRPAALNPSKVLAAASNYGAHVDEMRPRLRDQWLLNFGVFLKSPSAIIGPGDTLPLVDIENEVHHEAELAFIVGKQGKNIPEERAMEYVLGYTGLIDVSVRGEADRSYRKSFDGFCPIGPCLVTADEFPDPHNIDIKLWVNDDLRQDGNSKDMLVQIPQMIAFASQAMTLYPGDVFTTGTPDGVGPIAPGDTLTLEVQEIGRMQIFVKQA
jgi:2-keto-4-pentenoate hydratase/2-oxohepta-3-ene-1,7-dioic acid hydratase in catechol pathway